MQTKALKRAIKALQAESRHLRGPAQYYMDTEAPSYEPDYERWVEVSEAIEVLQAMIPVK